MLLLRNNIQFFLVTKLASRFAMARLFGTPVLGRTGAESTTGFWPKGRNTRTDIMKTVKGH